MYWFSVFSKKFSVTSSHLCLSPGVLTRSRHAATQLITLYSYDPQFTKSPYSNKKNFFSSAKKLFI